MAPVFSGYLLIVLKKKTKLGAFLHIDSSELATLKPGYLNEVLRDFILSMSIQRYSREKSIYLLKIVFCTITIFTNTTCKNV